jgi:hypothetical protein
MKHGSNYEAIRDISNYLNHHCSQDFSEIFNANKLVKSIPYNSQRIFCSDSRFLWEGSQLAGVLNKIRRVVQNRGKERKRKEKKGKEKEREEGEKGNFLFISMNFFALVYFFFVGCRAEATGPAWKPLFLRCKKVKAEDPKKRGVDSLKGGSTQARIQV